MENNIVLITTYSIFICCSFAEGGSGSDFISVPWWIASICPSIVTLHLSPNCICFLPREVQLTQTKPVGYFSSNFLFSVGQGGIARKSRWLKREVASLSLWLSPCLLSSGWLISPGETTAPLQQLLTQGSLQILVKTPVSLVLETASCD